MYFGQFNRKLTEQKSGVSVARQLRCFGHLIEMTTDQIVTIDGETTDLNTIEEARQYILNKRYEEQLEEEAKTDLYEELSDTTIAEIIQEHHNVKVTDTLIESYLELASSRIFTIDPVVQDIRGLNKLDKLVEGKIDYKLNDGTIIAINESTQEQLNILLQDQQEVIEYMRESYTNFLDVLEQIGE